MITFSQLVDQVVGETGRTNQLTASVRLLNQTIKEVHATEEGHPVLFPRNLLEDQLTANLDTGFMWSLPVRFQRMQTVSYPSICINNKPVFPKFLLPSRKMNEWIYVYYMSGSSLVFIGYGGVDALINLAYYALPARLVYYAVGNRPAQVIDEEWVYYDLTPDGLDYTQPENQEAARDLVSNWILTIEEDVLSWGLKSGLYSSVGDDRASVHYSKFNKLRTQMIDTHEAIVVSPE